MTESKTERLFAPSDGAVAASSFEVLFGGQFSGSAEEFEKLYAELDRLAQGVDWTDPEAVAALKERAEAMGLVVTVLRDGSTWTERPAPKEGEPWQSANLRAADSSTWTVRPSSYHRGDVGVTAARDQKASRGDR